MNDDLYFYCFSVLTTSVLLFFISLLFSWRKTKENRMRFDVLESRLTKAERVYTANTKSLCNCANGVSEVKDQLNLVHARLIQRSVDNVKVKVKGGNVNTGQQVIKDED